MSDDDRANRLDELSPPITTFEPLERTVPFVFSSPHSGRIYPSHFLAQSRLDASALRKSEDCYVDELFSGVARLGAPLLAARFPRAYLDVNREPYELDPQLFTAPPPDFANTQSLRVAGGLGTIARVVSESEEIYSHRISLDDAFARIDQLYHPYHDSLTQMIAATRRRFGLAVLIDCHSMPSLSPGVSNSGRPHVVLGDRFGASCSGRLTKLVREAFLAHGMDVALNRPYAGGFITEHYGRPADGVHALQIEVNRALYMREDTMERTGGFVALRDTLSLVFARIFQEQTAFFVPRAAAE